MLSKLLVDKLVFEPDFEKRAYWLDAPFTIGRIVEGTSPTGFGTCNSRFSIEIHYAA